MKELGYKIQNKIQRELTYIVANNYMKGSYLKNKLEKAIEDINDGNFTLYVSFDKLLATGENNGAIYLTINIEQNNPQEYLTIKSEIVIPKLNENTNLAEDNFSYSSFMDRMVEVEKITEKMDKPIIIYNMQTYLDDIKRLILENKKVYAISYMRELDNMSMVRLEEELNSITGKSYYELTGNKVGF